jgi:hypothetical protein
MGLLWALAAVCTVLVALLAAAHVGAAVLCLRSGRPVAWVPLVVSLLGVGVVFGLSRVAPLPGVALVVLPLVLLARRYGGQQAPQLTTNH